MIIPTAEFDPMFADDGVPFAEKMNAYIVREFADLLGQGDGVQTHGHLGTRCLEHANSVERPEVPQLREAA